MISKNRPYTEGMKVLMIVCDGLGDRPVKVLGGRTPLQAAKKENLNWFAAQGICGLMDPIGPGIRPGSDTSHLALFGYDPYKIYTGRGPFEAAGVGLDVRAGDVAFRCNFATVDEEMRVVDRRAGRIEKGTHELVSAINGIRIEDTSVFLREGTAHRAALVLRGPGLSFHVTDVDPHKTEGRVSDCLAKSPEAEKTARIVNEFVKRSYEALRNHPVSVEREKRGKPPANILLPRGAGEWRPVQSFQSKHRMRAAFVVGVTLVRGICRTLGMDEVAVAGATGGLDTDMIGKAKAAIEALKDHDFVYMNIKAPDICGHDGLPEKKTEIVEKLDGMFGFLRDRISEDWVVVVTADHSTPTSVGDHSGDPVPIAIFGSTVRVDDVAEFDEISVAKGGLGRIRGMDLMSILLNLSNRAEKYGA